MIEYGLMNPEGVVVTATTDPKSKLATDYFDHEYYTSVFRTVSEWKKRKAPSKYTRPRGCCSVCLRTYPLASTGLVFAHDKPRVKKSSLSRFSSYTGQCEGSRKPPKEGSDGNGEGVVQP